MRLADDADVLARANELHRLRLASGVDAPRLGIVLIEGRVRFLPAGGGAAQSSAWASMIIHYGDEAATAAFTAIFAKRGQVWRR